MSVPTGDALADGGRGPLTLSEPALHRVQLAPPADQMLARQQDAVRKDAVAQETNPVHGSGDHGFVRVQPQTQVRHEFAVAQVGQPPLVVNGKRSRVYLARNSKSKWTRIGLCVATFARTWADQRKTHVLANVAT